MRYGVQEINASVFKEKEAAQGIAKTNTQQARQKAMQAPNRRVKHRGYRGGIADRKTLNGRIPLWVDRKKVLRTRIVVCNLARKTK